MLCFYSASRFERSCLSGVLLASLVPLSSARLLGVDSAISDSSESSSSSPDQQSGHPDQEAAVAAR